MQRHFGFCLATGLALLYSELGLSKRHGTSSSTWQLTTLQVSLGMPCGQAASHLVEVCAFLRDAPRAATLYQLLLPYAQRNIMAGGHTACLASASRYLGLLAATMSNRQLSSAVYDAMYEAGLFAMLAPKAHGGLDYPVDTMRVWEAVARLDASAAWNLVMNQAIAAYAAWLPAAGAQELFRDGPPTVAGALNPPAAATRVDGGWRITGQCPSVVGATMRSGWPCQRKWTVTTRRLTP